MSNELVRALTSDKGSNVVRTENNMKAYKTTYNACLDLFALGAAYRERSEEEIRQLFQKAYREDSDVALRVIAYFRDAREGAGERKFFRTCIQWLAMNNVAFNIPYIPVIGRWDDLIVLIDTPYRDKVLRIIAEALTREKPDGLCAKWMPRKGKVARLLRESMGLYHRDYRRLLVANTQVVETQMCQRNWAEINYKHVPSVANIKYNDAFLRNDEERRRDFLAAAKKGEVKIHSSVAFPHTIIRMLLPRGRFIIHDSELLGPQLQKNDTAIAMWKQLPNVIGDGSKRILVCSDVSNSMRPPHSRTDDPFCISLALGIYCSERLTGPFQNAFISFSRQPYLQYTEGDIYERLSQIRVDNPRNTNLEAIFRLVLDTALKNNLDNGALPSDVVIISDMEFDIAVGYPKDDAFTAIRKMYADSGYDIPNLIFWNVNARNDHHPIQRDSRGVVLISGASQNAIKAFVSGVTTPTEAMLKVIDTERYGKFLEDSDLRK